MSSISFIKIHKNPVIETAKRVINFKSVTSSIGPLVHIEKDTGIIHVTAYLFHEVIEKNIKIPESVEITENKGKKGIKITIENTQKAKKKSETGLLKRKHWEFSLEPTEQDRITLLSLDEIEVEVDFNEETDPQQRISSLEALKKIQNIVKNISNSTNEKKANKKVKKIKEIIDKIPFDGEPRRGTIFIPPK